MPAPETVLLRAIRSALINFPGGLKAWFQDGDDSVDGEISISTPDGRTHFVSVQVGAREASVNTSIWDHKPIDGVEKWTHVGVRTGALRKLHMPEQIVRDVVRALGKAGPDAFEPVRGPGVATHPWYDLAISSAKDACKAAGHDYRTAVNSADQRLPGEDVVSFLDADGAALDVAIATMPGGIQAVRLSDGAVLAKAYTDKAAKVAEVVAVCAEELAAKTSPGP